MLTFIRGPATFVTSGQIYLKFLPDGQPVQLTHDDLHKLSPVFSHDGSHIAYTGLNSLSWNTYEVPVTGGEPQLLLPNATGLTWLDSQRLLFSEVRTGIHMGLVTASATRSGERDVYFPPEQDAMVHRSYASPDRKWILAAEMKSDGWRRCRLLPLDGGSVGAPIGPEGHCLSAAWSPDGKWMYFETDAGGSGYHIWRMKFPDGPAQQLTFGPTEENGIAISADGRFLITSVGTTQSAVWLHDRKGDHQLSSEGYSFDPALSADGNTLYFLQAGLAPNETRLLRVDARTGASQELVSAVDVDDFSVSYDDQHILYSVKDKDRHSHLWLVSADHRVPPKQITAGSGEFGAQFLKDGSVVFLKSENGADFLYHMKLDGSELRRLTHTPIILGFFAMSPDGRWLAAVVPVPNEDPPAAVMIFHTDDGKATRLCNFCFPSWSADGKDFYVSFPEGGSMKSSTVTHTYLFRLKPGAGVPALPPLESRSEADFAKLGTLLGVTLANEFVPGPSPDVYAYSQRTIQRNLYRVPLP